MMRGGRSQAFTAPDLLTALLLSVAARAPRDDIALLEQTQALARVVGWHPIWDVLLVALAQEISAGHVRLDAMGSLHLTPAGKRHLSMRLAMPIDQATAALQTPFAKLKRKLTVSRTSAARLQAATRAESA